MKRNKFSLSHYKLLTCDMGELVPIGVMETLPGDTFQHSTSLLVRASPLVAPVMHPVNVRIHHWFVPFRLIWEDWEKFITGDEVYSFPSINVGIGSGFDVGTLTDYLGIPPLDTQAQLVSALPYRAYALIFNEWYRDQDLVSELPISVASGNDAITNTVMTNVAWEKDYFTTARPWTQKGSEVAVPVTGLAPVKGIGKGSPTFATGAQVVRESDKSAPTYTKYAGPIDGTSAQNQFFVQGTTDDYPNIHADLGQAASASINDLRLAFALQRYQEARARYGSRYTEYLAYLGVRSSDARLQRPEYLGGGKATIQFSEVLQTGPTTAGSPTGVGNLKGHGITGARSNRYRRFFEEHGLIMSLLSVKPRTMYTQGISRMWSRKVKEDFWQKELEHIGQQEVFKREIYADQIGYQEVFGYQDRYDEYRRMESGIAGEFRTTALDYWHLARQFAAPPALNASLVQAVPSKRIFQSTNTDGLLIMGRHSVAVRRQLSKVGTAHIF